MYAFIKYDSGDIKLLSLVNDYVLKLLDEGLTLVNDDSQYDGLIQDLYDSYEDGTLDYEEAEVIALLLFNDFIPENYDKEKYLTQYIKDIKTETPFRIQTEEYIVGYGPSKETAMLSCLGYLHLLK